MLSVKELSHNILQLYPLFSCKPSLPIPYLQGCRRDSQQDFASQGELVMAFSITGQMKRLNYFLERF